MKTPLETAQKIMIERIKVKLSDRQFAELRNRIADCFIRNLRRRKISLLGVKMDVKIATLLYREKCKI